MYQGALARISLIIPDPRLRIQRGTLCLLCSVAETEAERSSETSCEGSGASGVVIVFVKA